MSGVEHIRVKIFADAGEGFDAGGAIPVFHRWIQRRALNETMIDVADYRHMAAGPGILLVCHDAFYSLDMRHGRLGLLYTRRTAMEGSAADKVAAAVAAARGACERLEQEPEFAGRLKFRAGDFEIGVNDRLLAPNTDATFAAMEPPLRSVLDGLLGAGRYSLTPSRGARDLFAVAVQAR